MTREEAIAVFKAFMDNSLFSDAHKAAFNIAIHDIKQRHDWDINNLILINKDNYEPTTKDGFINNHVIESFKNKINDYEKDYKFSKEEIINILERYELKYAKPTTKNDLGVDCISREEVINYLCKHCPDDGECFKDCDEIKHLRQLPSVTPIRPKGHWICDGKGRSFADYHCSECGLKLALCGQDIKQRQDSGYSLFCGGCGADMREVEE